MQPAHLREGRTGQEVKMEGRGTDNEAMKISISSVVCDLGSHVSRPTACN